MPLLKKPDHCPAVELSTTFAAYAGVALANVQLHDAQAFDVLVRLSQDTDRKLPDVAELVVAESTSDQPVRGPSRTWGV